MPERPNEFKLRGHLRVLLVDAKTEFVLNNAEAILEKDSDFVRFTIKRPGYYIADFQIHISELISIDETQCRRVLIRSSQA